MTTPVQTSNATSAPKPTAKHNPTVLLNTSRTTSTRELRSYENVICGATAGLVSRFLVAPFDVVKITLQLETHRQSLKALRPGGVFACARRIFQREGIKGLFKGNLSAEYLYLTYGATQFLAFSTIEKSLRGTGMPKKVRSFCGGALAGAVATSVTYPFDLLRTRFIAQEINNRVHESIVGAVRQIAREEGVRGFYRGLWPACLQIMPYMGIVFTCYDVLGSGYRWVRRSLIVSDSQAMRALDSVQDALIGGGSAVIGKCCVYPLDLVRKRLQVQGPHLHSYAHGSVPMYSGMSNALLYIVRNEGFLALFRGLTPALIKAAPASASIFYIYGYTRDLILTLKPEQ
ncbi:mitochondrial thiamine pyrophosphate transporter [Coemansia sp. RSA 2607]|nr:mitochondrial thiamine pyrophosphate transporter [Coemansia sp. RSA 2607]